MDPAPPTTSVAAAAAAVESFGLGIRQRIAARFSGGGVSASAASDPAPKELPASELTPPSRWGLGLLASSRPPLDRLRDKLGSAPAAAPASVSSAEFDQPPEAIKAARFAAAVGGDALPDDDQPTESFPGSASVVPVPQQDAITAGDENAANGQLSSATMVAPAKAHGPIWGLIEKVKERKEELVSEIKRRSSTGAG